VPPKGASSGIAGAVRVLAACAVCLVPTAESRADVRPAVQTPACVPGGVAAIPLRRDPGDAWPSTVEVKVGGFTTVGVVAWVASRATPVRHWTSSNDQVQVRAIADAPREAPPEATGAVIALVELPAISGAMEVLGVALEPNWLLDRALPVTGTGVLPWPVEPAPGLPDTGTCSEYWRWCLLAEARGEQPPPAPGDAMEQLWARHVASLWMAGLHRVKLGSEGVHRELIESLTAVAGDPHLPPPGEVAAWIADPGDVSALLGVLLEASTRPEQIAQSALSWVRAHWPFTVWVEADAGDRVLLAVANPLRSEQVLRLRWVTGADPTGVALVAPPRSVSRHWVDRPALPATTDSVPIDRMRPEQAELQCGPLRRRLAVGPREYPARPPGLSFGTLAPPLTLAEAQQQRMQPVPLAWQTTASLRRRQGRWEFIVECMRPAVGTGGVQADADDEITLRIGDPESPLRTVRVSVEGALGVDGGLTDGVTAGFMRWSDRWRVRIEIPNAWLPAATGASTGVEARPMMFSLERESGDGRPRQTAGLAVPPWKRLAPAVMVDLGPWSDLGAH
jgi:hypothetical protein